MIMWRKLLARKPGALNALYVTQFLSAFADNVIFFSILGIATRHGISRPDDYMANVQTAFLLAYVVLAPIVGALADKHAKSHILMLGNLIKAAGILLILAGIHPVLCYAVVGIGAVVYSPAKYGILTELTATDEQLLRANGMLESYTIVAILTGTLTGGVLADLSETAGTAACIALYAASLAMTFWIPRMKGRRNVEYGRSIREFFRETGLLFANRKTHFALVGNGAFWMTAAVLRIAFLAWLPVYLHIFGKTAQSAIFSCTAIGIVIGSLLTPKLVKVDKYYRSILYGFLMVVVICAAPFLQNVVLICIALLLVGFLGGVFVIPMNTVLQAEGERMIGSGKTIAIQNMVQNMLMIVGLFLFKLAGAAGMSLIASIVGLAALLLLFVLYIGRYALSAGMSAE
jgi:LPLT family lysophospholipid transporter-like MFS transporter